MGKTNDSNIFCVGDTFEIRKGDKLNIGIPEYIVIKNSVSPSYVLTKNIIQIGSTLKPDKKYTDDDLFLAITEAVHKVSGIAPNKSNNLGNSVDKLIADIRKVEKKLLKTFDTSVFAGEWKIDRIEPCHENGAQCIVRITKTNQDGSVMHNFIRAYGNERIKFRF